MENKVDSYRILVSTPHKFIELVQNPINQNFVDSVDIVVLDEADKFFELNFMS